MQPSNRAFLERQVAQFLEISVANITTEDIAEFFLLRGEQAGLLEALKLANEKE